MIQLQRLQITVHPKITLLNTANGVIDLEGNYIAEHEADGIYKIWDADGSWSIINPQAFSRVGIKVVMGQAIIS